MRRSSVSDDDGKRFGLAPASGDDLFLPFAPVWAAGSDCGGGRWFGRSPTTCCLHHDKGAPRDTPPSGSANNLLRETLQGHYGIRAQRKVTMAYVLNVRFSILCTIKNIFPLRV